MSMSQMIFLISIFLTVTWNFKSIAKWDDALDLAEKQDRLHLRATHYQYAKKCEWEKDIQGAIQEEY